MRRFHQTTRGLTAGLLLTLSWALLAGCMSGGEPPGAVSADLIGPDAGVIATAVWNAAPAGCEGRMSGGNVHIGWAEGRAELGVVLSRGQILCVDSWAAIEAELDRLKGDPSPDPMLPPEFELPDR
ncbi:MAG: hypothetical protein GXP55_24715 [Deltaproteobacteria bacterium]|nr:hypothetical protein [Deltaproteobacteria bacterium]